MSAEKNHEQYLEQIETAVANTTMDILEKHSGDLRAMAKLVAEKQVEINRLKEYYNDDRKTIRSLRVKLNGAVDENKELKEQLEDDTRQVHTLFTENEELKEEIKELKRGDKRKLKKQVAELEKEIEGLNEYTSDYDTEVEMRSLAEEQLEELQNEHQGICSKYHADFCELEDKREEVMRLNKFKEASISQVNSHLEQIVELKEENKKLARMVADQTLKVCRLKINEELK